jgi:hypothetical protein
MLEMNIDAALYIQVSQLERNLVDGFAGSTQRSALIWRLAGHHMTRQTKNRGFARSVIWVHMKENW